MGRDDWFEKQIDELYPRLHRSMKAYLAGSGVEAEDILQETFLKAYKNIDQFEGNANMYTWLYSIARNKCIDEFRKRKYESNRSSIPVEEYNIESDEFKSKDQQEDTELLKEAISELPELLRSIVVMKSIDGLTYPEISDVTGVNEQTLKNRMFRARKQLADILKKMGVNQS
ncbi:RNA polymerase sigma factor [Rhodohalobacter sulfatireducens]|uniref:RNA polymerase sigma factor n=1 Tax=Rhodohalobacter sulfatireducens TaxID=2911366 RepID=A0ABS9KCD2_9BACT|nr:RNA polymerase sigma factor [Rhodohalobacter sulfatireducens]MCG2588473.1 RNA polymerase sigma factor [Rhodohalobacter sulfatireducens]